MFLGNRKRYDESSPLHLAAGESMPSSTPSEGWDDDDTHPRFNDGRGATSTSSVSSFLKGCTKWTTGGTITLLIAANVFLFVQIQAVTIQVASNKKQIQHLQDSIAHQQKQTDTINDKVEQERSLTIIHMAGTFVLLTCLVTLFHMTSHLRRFNQPDIQRKIVSILWMTPIYGVASFVSICLPSTHEYMMVLKDFYESYCIYQFLAFLVAVLGRDGGSGSHGGGDSGGHDDREAAIEALSVHADHLATPFKCLNCFFHPPPNESDYAKSKAVLLETQILALQFVIVKPITSILLFALDLTDGLAKGRNNDSYIYTNNDAGSHLFDVVHLIFSARLWILVVQNVSVWFAFTGLLKFYHAVADDLRWMQPFSKFLSIKGVVFMTFWQSMILSLLIHSQHRNVDNSSTVDTSDGTAPETDQEVAAMIQNILICLEMLFFSLAHFCVFPADEWEPGYVPVQMARPGLAFKDFARDVSLVIDHTSEGVVRSRRSRYNYRTSTETESTEGKDIIKRSSAKKSKDSWVDENSM